MVYGQPVYNTDQRREALRQIKEYFQEQWLKKKAAGLLPKKKISLLPNKTTKKRRRRRRRTLINYKIKIIKRRKR